MTELPDNTKLYTQNTEDILNNKQLEHYKNWRHRFATWLTEKGKTPEKYDGYADDTVRKTMTRTDHFMRYVWSEEDTYTLQIEPAMADLYIQEIILESTTNYSPGHKSNTQNSLQRLFRWLNSEDKADIWEPTLSFSANAKESEPKEFLTKQERGKVREAALEYGSIPGYNDLSPQERDTWKAHLAQRFGKPKHEVVPADWKRANGYKFVSLVWTCLDTGLRPVEVEHAKTSWVDIENRRLIIPKEDAAKSEKIWRPALRDDTTEMLKHWLEERECYEKYDDTDRLWLTREGNPYQTNSLKYLIEHLCEDAGIPTENRKISWYAIRHSVGTYISDEKDLKAAKSQLRHKSKYTSMQYDQTPEDQRREALEHMN